MLTDFQNLSLTESINACTVGLSRPKSATNAYLHIPKTFQG